MERKDRKRKAMEIADSPRFAAAKINELASELAASDAILRGVIGELREEVGSLKKQLVEKCEECEHAQEEAAFLHPDAVIDRVRVKLWHSGDLTLLRKVIEPRTRVLRNTEARSGRALYLCDTPPKKAGGKAPVSGGTSDELSPKVEGEQASPASPTNLVTSMGEDDGNAEVQQQEEEQEEFVFVAPVEENEAQAKSPLQQDMAVEGPVDCEA